MAQTTVQGSFLGDASVTGAKVAADFISAQTALTTGLATTDEILISDAGVIKRMDISVLEIAATQITASGTLPALNGAALTALTAANITASGTLPALNGAALTALTAANITASGTLPALNGAALTALTAANITASGTLPALNGAALTALNGTQVTSGTLPAARIAADSIVEGKLNVSNGPTNGHVLTARDGVAGGFTWEAAAGGTTVPLLLDQGSGDTYILELQSSDVTHGISGYDTNTFGLFMKKHASSGMLQMWGFSDADANQAIGLSMVGVSGIAANATKTTSAIGIVEILAGIKSGSSIANPAASGNILVVRDAASGSAKMIVDQDGSLTLPTAGSKFHTGGGTTGSFHLKVGASGSTPHSAYNHVSFENSGRMAVNVVVPSNSEGHFGFVWPSYSQGAGCYTNSNSGSGYYAIQVHGGEKLRIASSGNVTGAHGTYHTSSDSRIKENVADITFGLSHVLQMRPVSFNFTDWYDRDGVQETRLGFIAQEVKAVVPNAVKVATQTMEFNYDDDNDVRTVLHEPITDMHSIEDTQMIPVLVKAIQELNARIDGLS